MIIAGCEKRAVICDTNGRYADFFSRDELVSAPIGAKVEDANIASAVGGDDFTLVGMDYYIVDRGGVGVVALDGAGTGIPDFYSLVFGARDHPLCVDMEGDGSYVVCVAFEHHYWGGVGRFNVVEADDMAPGCSEVFLIGGYAEAVDLGFGVLDCTTADAAEGFPEADCMVIPGCKEVRVSK